MSSYFFRWTGKPESPGATGESEPPVRFLPYIAAGGRDLRLDMLRGLFVLAMVVDHTGGPSALQWVMGGNRFFTSAAEGFLLLSGLVSGLVYHRLTTRDGLKRAVSKALSRAFALYLLGVGLTLLLVPVSEAFDLPWAQGLDGAHPLTFVVGVLTLHRTYFMTDVLLLYTLLFGLLPGALFLMYRGKVGWLLGASWFIWGLYQFFPDTATILWPVAGNPMFAFSAWQVLFISGLALGYCRDRFPALTAQGERRLHWLTGTATLGLSGLYLVMQQPAASLPALLRPLGTDGATGIWFQQHLFGEMMMEPGRIVASIIVFSFLLLSLTRWWPVLHRLGSVLTPLGQNALYAFAAHVVVVTAVALLLVFSGLSGKSPEWLNALFQVGAVALIWLLARHHVLAPTIDSLRYWRRSPAWIAVLVAVLLPWLPLAPVQAQAPASATLAGVPAAILARARAYGTPIAGLQRAAAVQTAPTPPPTSTMAAQQPGSAPEFAAGTAYAPSATPIADSTAAATAADRGSGQAATPAPDPVMGIVTPDAGVFASLANPMAADLGHGSAGTSSAADQVAASKPSALIRPAPVPVQQAAASVPPAAPAVEAAPPVQKAVAAPAVARAATATPVAAPVVAPAKPAPVLSVTTDPLPALPPDSQRLKSQYVGTLAGRAYARTFHSDIVNRDMTYWVYLPPDYGKTNRRYPVVYALHGGGGLVDEWAAYGLFDAADQAFARGTLQPFIIVLPQGDKSYWANWAVPGPRWGDYLAYEVVNQVDTSFGTIRNPAARAVGGLSMGAWGALHQGLTHPDIFGVVAASSASLYPDHDNLQYLGTGAAFAAKDPMSLVRTAPGAPSLRIWLDVGAADPWVSQMTAVHDTLLQRGIAHEWHLNDGPHAPEYWATHVPDYLAFYARALAHG